MLKYDKELSILVAVVLGVISLRVPILVLLIALVGLSYFSNQAKNLDKYALSGILLVISMVSLVLGSAGYFDGIIFRDEGETQEELVADTLTSDERDYITFVEETTNEYSKLFDGLDKLLNNIESSRYWEGETGRVVGSIGRVSNNIIDYGKVPKRYEAVHEKYVGAAKVYGNSMTLFVEGYESGDEALISLSLSMLEEGNKLLEDTAREFAEVLEEI